jgi:hypothetical protein
MPRIRAVFDGVSVFGAGQRLEAIFDVLILLPRHSALLSLSQSVEHPELLSGVSPCSEPHHSFSSSS